MYIVIGIVLMCYAGFCTAQTLLDMRKDLPKEAKPPVTMQSHPNPGADTAPSPEGESPQSEEVP
jgi:hypothetical protein